MKWLVNLILLVSLAACQTPKSEDAKPTTVGEEPTSQPASQPIEHDEPEVVYDLEPQGMNVATFAGGCFWCMEKPFESIDGVSAVISGYTAGTVDHPTYKQVGRGETGHTEAIRVIYDPAKVKYELLLDVFWRNIDPTQVNGQFVDHGTQYRTGIYYHNEEQHQAAQASLDALLKSGIFKSIATEIKPAGPFWPAEEYHQDFYIKSPTHYQRYRGGSGRDEYLKETWGEEAGGYSLHGAKH